MGERDCKLLAEYSWSVFFAHGCILKPSMVCLNQIGNFLMSCCDGKTCMLGLRIVDGEGKKGFVEVIYQRQAFPANPP